MPGQFLPCRRGSQDGSCPLQTRTHGLYANAYRFLPGPCCEANPMQKAELLCVGLLLLAWECAGSGTLGSSRYYSSQNAAIQAPYVRQMPLGQAGRSSSLGPSGNGCLSSGGVSQRWTPPRSSYGLSSNPDARYGHQDPRTRAMLYPSTYLGLSAQSSLDALWRRETTSLGMSAPRNMATFQADPPSSLDGLPHRRIPLGMATPGSMELFGR